MAEILTVTVVPGAAVTSGDPIAALVTDRPTPVSGVNGVGVGAGVRVAVGIGDGNAEVGVVVGVRLTAGVDEGTGVADAAPVGAGERVGVTGAEVAGAEVAMTGAGVAVAGTGTVGRAVGVGIGAGDVAVSAVAGVGEEVGAGVWVAGAVVAVLLGVGVSPVAESSQAIRANPITSIGITNRIFGSLLISGLLPVLRSDVAII